MPRRDAGPETAPGPAPAPTRPAERIVVACPNCSTPLSVRRAYLGKQVRCKQCDEPFLVDGSRRSPQTRPRSPRTPADDGVARALPGRSSSSAARLEQGSAENRRLREAHDLVRTEHEQFRAERDQALAAQRGAPDRTWGTPGRAMRGSRIPMPGSRPLGMRRPPRSRK